MNVKAHIWEIPAYLPYVQPPLTETIIANAEGTLGFRLPSEYLNLLRVQNGGYIRYTLPETLHRVIAGIGPHFPNLCDFNWDEVRESVSFALDGLVPFDGDGHWHLCLDYRENSTAPKVAYVDVECDHQTPVADSFAGYLSLLRIETDENEFVLLNVPDLELVKRILSTALPVAFDAPSSYDHGYPVHRGRIAAGQTSEWIWLSPNLVARGFSRADEERFEELRRLFPGESRRYPELPASSYILAATPGLVRHIGDIGKKHSWDIRPLSEYVL